MVVCMQEMGMKSQKSNFFEAIIDWLVVILWEGYQGCKWIQPQDPQNTAFINTNRYIRSIKYRSNAHQSQWNNTSFLKETNNAWRTHRIPFYTQNPKIRTLCPVQGMLQILSRFKRLKSNLDKSLTVYKQNKGSKKLLFFTTTTITKSMQSHSLIKKTEHVMLQNPNTNNLP